MHCSKTGWPSYRDQKGACVYAAEITALEDCPQHTLPDGVACKLSFGGLGKESIFRRMWITENNPSVGGYVLLADVDGGNDNCACWYLSLEKFISEYTKE